MPGYRFCRSDDVALLVAAHNACWVPYFGRESAMTVEDFKRGIREVGLWPSSCMVAFEGDEPIGVLIAAKRDGVANCVRRLAVRPGWERQGHGRHLLTSLADKAAILGPRRVLAEVPASWAEARTFFERGGFVAEDTYVDLALTNAAGPPVADATTERLLIAVTVDELFELGVLDGAARRAWSRSVWSLRACAADLAGLAIATDRIEAYVVFRDAAGGRDVVALGAAADEGAPRLLGALLDRVRAGGGRVRFPLVGSRDASLETLARLGFRREEETIGYAMSRG